VPTQARVIMLGVSRPQVTRTAGTGYRAVEPGFMTFMMPPLVVILGMT
jgi:hypothetical protein